MSNLQSLVMRAVGCSDTPAYCSAADCELVIAIEGICRLVSVSIQVQTYVKSQTHGVLRETFKGKKNGALLCGFSSR